MTWRLALLAIAAELRRRGDAIAAKNNAFVKCGAEKAEVADAKAQIYRYIADDLEYIAKEPSSTGLEKLRKWART